MQILKIGFNSIVEFQKVITHFTRNTHGSDHTFAKSELRPFEIVGKNWSFE